MSYYCMDKSLFLNAICWKAKQKHSFWNQDFPVHGVIRATHIFFLEFDRIDLVGIKILQTFAES